MTQRPQLGYFTHPSFLAFESSKGVLSSRGGTRLVGVSDDFLRGFVLACEYEAGDATKTILRSCGRFYGSRLAARIEAELGTFAGSPLRDRPMAHFEALIIDLFSGLGMGQIQIDFAAGRYGILPVSLQNSPMQDIGPKGHVADDLFCGLLEGFFSCFAGDDIVCIQTGDLRLGSKDGTTFLLAFPDQVKRVSELIASKLSHAQVVQKFCL